MDAFLQKPIPKQKKDVYIQLKSDKNKPNEPQSSSDTNQINIDNDSTTTNTTLQKGIHIVDKSDNKLIKKEDFFNQSFEIPEEEQEPPPKVKVKKTKKKLLLKNVDQIEDKKKRVTPKPKEFTKDVEYSIEDFDRLKAFIPERDDDIRLANEYYLNNKKGFISFMNSFLINQKLDSVEEITCDTLSNTENKAFSLLPHQKIVREYLNTYTPYRGLLLYHGLGSGKTCSSIAIAEGMKTDRQILIMTPASLRMNYVEELKKCGDPFYKKNQYWEYLSTDKDNAKVKMYSDLLQIDESSIRKRRGIWITNKNRPSNYNSLNSQQKKSLNKQLNEMIISKYQFINYNGLRLDKYKILTANRTKNIFDGKVVVIDEAHNLISRIVNKQIKKDTKSLSLQLYEDLMMATNCKIVLLTGTPIINYSIELSILFNILRGYIKVWYIKINTNSDKKINTEYFQSILKNVITLDYIEYIPSTQTLSIMRNPYQFVNDTAYDSKTGVLYDKESMVSDGDFQSEIVNILQNQDIQVQNNGISIKLFKALPDDMEEFKNLYINDDYSIKNANMLKKRIIGLTSYFKSPAERLMPSYDPETDFQIVKIPMSDEQFKIYNDARKEERKQETQNKKRARNNQEGSSTYRIFSRLFCNFVFPLDIIERPLPNQKDNVVSSIQNKDENISEEVIEGRQALVSEFNENSEEAEKMVMKYTDDSYDQRLLKALQEIKKHANTILSKEGLSIQSPKFLNLLENILSDDYNGLHLVYSQFVTLEGLGIFALVLEHHGFSRFQVKKQNNKFDIQFEPGKPCYVLYTGSETEEERELIRNIFNGDWNVIPTNIKKKLKSISEHNHYGEIIKVFMITQSGAEGISLKNVRYVHLMEPYWHNIRQKQVIGRARRICSHNELPEDERNVKVFQYMMTLTKEQTQGDKSIELRAKDKSKLDKSKYVTTDEALYEIASIKENVIENLLKVVKETAIDCIHTDDAKTGQLKCFNFGDNTGQDLAYHESYSTQEKDNIAQQNKVKITWKAKVVTSNKKKYAMRMDAKGRPTYKLYNLESYKRALKDPNVMPIFIGTFITKGDRKGEIVYNVDKVSNADEIFE